MDILSLSKCLATYALHRFMLGKYEDLVTGVKLSKWGAFMTGKSILFVDDEEILAKIGKKILAKLGHKVTIFTNSIDAFKVFCQTPYKFDMLITDYNMPRLNGGQLAIKIKEIRKNLPVILVTGYKNFAEDDLTEWGIDGLLVKPYQLEKLLELVQHLLTSSNEDC